MLKNFAVTLIVAVFWGNTKAQEVQFNQYVFNGLYINPAYAGYKIDYNINSFYSSQWTGVDGAPKTVSITADGSFNDQKVGLGLVLQSASIGAQSNIAAYGNYSYRIRLDSENDSKLAFGLGIGFIQSGIDGSKLSASQSNDSYIPSGFVNAIYPDARFGVLYTNSNTFVSFSIDNILANYLKGKSTNELFVPVPLPNLYLHFGALIKLNDDLEFRPSVLVRDNRNYPTNVDFNTFLLIGDKFYLGSTYRSDISIYKKSQLQAGLQKSNAIIGTVGFSINKNLKIAYAFNYSTSKISSYAFGSHELSLSLIIPKLNSKNIENDNVFE